MSERAVDALAEIGSKRAVPRLLEMLHTPGNAQGDCRSWCARSASSATRNLSTCSCRCSRGPNGDPHRGDPGAVARSPTSRAPSRCAGELQAQASSPDQTIARMAAAAVTELDNRIAGISQLPPEARWRPHPPPSPPRLRSPRGVRPPQPSARGGDEDTGDLRSGPAAGGRRHERAPGHLHAQARRHHRGTLQVHRPHRPRRLRHRAADGRHGGR